MRFTLDDKEPTRKEKDKSFRELLISITRRYWNDVRGISLPSGYCLCLGTMRMLPYSELAVSHIKKRSTSPDLIYDLNNVQLLAHDVHDQQEKRAIPEDLRPNDYKEHIKIYGGISYD